MRPVKGDATATRQGVHTAADVRRVLGAEIENVMANPDLEPLQRARVLVQLAREHLHANDRATLEAQVGELQAALKGRRNPLSKEAKT
jgi:hypothetical protein